VFPLIPAAGFFCLHDVAFCLRSAVVRVLIACEFSGIVREAFRRRGHKAFSCDLLPAEDGSRFHLQEDVFGVIRRLDWDLMICHWPCTYACNSGVRWLKGNRDRWYLMEAYARKFKTLLNSKVPRLAMENPIPHRYAAALMGRKYDQIIHPWQFGHREMKATCIWVKNLPLLQATDNVGPPPTDKIEREKWARVHRAPPSPDRWKERSRTLFGVADAMAEQWGI
jgi:hypothetical protein